jgi:hypothetical protein
MFQFVVAPPKTQATTTAVKNRTYCFIFRFSWRMVSSGMLRHVALVRTYVSEELSSSFIRVTIVELGATLAVTRTRRWLLPVTLIMEMISSSETSVLTRATWHNTQEGTILHSHCRENLKSFRFSCLARTGCLSCMKITHFPTLALPFS